jgi:hypothetical protein
MKRYCGIADGRAGAVDFTLAAEMMQVEVGPVAFHDGGLQLTHEIDGLVARKTNAR